MEALSFLKFWKPAVSISSPLPLPLDDEEEEDSFFELNLNEDTETVTNSKSRAPLFSSPFNFFSTKKVLPFEDQRHSLRPQLRISKYWTFRTPSLSAHETEQVVLKTEQQGRANLCNSTVHGVAEKNSLLGSKRFLKIVNPFSGRVSEKEEVKTSPLSSPMVAAWKLTGKVRSFSSAAAKGGGILSPAREDDSVSLQHEGIQSAILHCKKSFHCCTTADAGDNN